MRTIVATVALAIACAVSLGMAAAAGGPKVIVATSGKSSETRKTIPITRQRDEGEVVMSMDPKHLPDLEAGDRLAVTAEVQVTNDCLFREPRCIGEPYRYTPTLDARLVLARGERATSGPGVVPISKVERHVCLNGTPDREHHCVVVFREGGMRITGDNLPCAPADCRVNLVMSAHNPQAEGGDVLPIGGTPPSGRVSQDRGRINALVFRPGDQPVPGAEVTTDRRLSRSPLDNRFRVIYSKRLDGLHAGDGISVDAHATVDVRGLPYNARVSSQLVLTDSPTAVEPGPIARKAAAGGGEISENNGFNCVRPRNPCTWYRVGVAKLAKDPVDSHGHAAPLYVNLTMLNTPKRVPTHNSGDRLTVPDRGAIRVTRYKK